MEGVLWRSPSDALMMPTPAQVERLHPGAHTVPGAHDLPLGWREAPFFPSFPVQSLGTKTSLCQASPF